MAKTRLSSSQKLFSQLPGQVVLMLLADESHRGLIAMRTKSPVQSPVLPSKSCAAVHLATVAVESDCGCKICHEDVRKWHL
eukprot:s59_g17.t1